MILQIFPNGQLCLPSDGGAVLPGSQVWALQPVNAALIILEAFVVLFTIRDILALCVSMWPCIQRWKPLVSLEHNIQQARMRDKVSFLLMPVLILVVRGVDLRTAPLGWIAAVVLAYYVVRRILYALIPHRKVNSEYWRACMNAASLFSVMLAVLWMLTVGAMVVLGTMLWISASARARPSRPPSSYCLIQRFRDGSVMLFIIQNSFDVR